MQSFVALFSTIGSESESVYLHWKDRDRLSCVACISLFRGSAAKTLSGWKKVFLQDGADSKGIDSVGKMLRALWHLLREDSTPFATELEDRKG